jgi:hypothetical protein
MNRIGRLALIVGLVALASGPSELRAARDCPGNITNGTIACHRLVCEGCTNAWYTCDDGWDYNWSVCALK